MQRLSKRKTNVSSPIPSPSNRVNTNDSNNDRSSLTTGIKLGPTSKNMDHSHREPLLRATVAAGVGSIGANHDTAKDNKGNNQSYGAITRLSQPPSSSASITRSSSDNEEEVEEEVVLEEEEEDEELVLEAEEHATAMDNISRKSQWILLAVASGACAAFNGVFAKLYVAFPSNFPARALLGMFMKGFRMLASCFVSS